MNELNSSETAVSPQAEETQDPGTGHRSDRTKVPAGSRPADQLEPCGVESAAQKMQPANRGA